MDCTWVMPKSSLGKYLVEVSRAIKEEARLLLQSEDLCLSQEEICTDLYWSCDDYSLEFLAYVVGLQEPIFMSFVKPQYTTLPCSGHGKSCNEPINILCADREEFYRIGRMDFFCVDCTATRRLEAVRARVAQKEVAEKIAKEERVAELRSMPYPEYLKTDHWQAVRAAARQADGNACRVCGSPDNLNVHHRTYERRGCEDPGDVITLCQPCHQLFHENGKLAKPEG